MLSLQQIRLKVSANLASEKILLSSITIEERRPISALSKDLSITILPGNKGRCTVIFNTSGYHTKITSLLCDRTIYEVLKRNPISSYKKNVIDYLQKIEKDHITDSLT